MRSVSRLAFAALVTGALLTACQPAAGPTEPPPAALAPAAPSGGTGPVVGSSPAPMPAPGACSIRQQGGQPLPDPGCTPGALNPAVTQATIGATICVAGWTATVRPPTSVTDRMKRESAASYGLTATEAGEYDHLVSLELGGAPDDPRNLWVEPGPIPNPKDAVENRLAAAVCSGLVPLDTAQRAIAADWVTALDTAGLTVVGGKLCLRAQPTHCATGRTTATTGAGH